MSLSRATIGLVATCWLIGAPPVVLAQDVSSKFIDDMPPLEPSPVVPGAMRWRKDGVDFGTYGKLMFDRVQFVYAEDSASKSIDPAQLAAIGNELVARIREAMEPEFPVVAHAGPGVMRARVAITEVRINQVKKEKPMQGVFGLMPAGIAINAVSSGAAEETDLSGARIEVEEFDAVTGERIGIFFDSEPGKHGGGGKTWESLEKSFVFYGSRLRKRFELDHKR